jgi:hypothetical protein
MEDAYTEPLILPAIFYDSDYEEKEENNGNLIVANYDGEDMPTIEWNREQGS